MSNKASVIIINYNSGKYTKKLISSLELIKNNINEIVIIDNNSVQSDKKIIRNIKEAIVVFNNKNVGFAAAVNQGINISKSDYIILLNPDTLIIDSSINKLFRHFKKRNVAVVGGAMINSQNKEYHTANSIPSFFTALFEFTNLKKLFINNYWSKHFWIETIKQIYPIEVDSLCGAFLIIKKNIKGITRYFDENYFMYLEDLDYCINLRKKGLKIIFDPTYKIKHYGGKSNNSKYGTILKYWYKSRKYYFFKNLTQPFGIILNIIFTTETIILSLYHYLKNEPTE